VQFSEKFSQVKKLLNVLQLMSKLHYSTTKADHVQAINSSIFIRRELKLLAGPPKPVRSRMREEAKNNTRRREL
jgi:hypothetical protein